MIVSHCWQERTDHRIHPCVHIIWVAPDEVQNGRNAKMVLAPIDPRVVAVHTVQNPPSALGRGSGAPGGA